MCLSRVEKFKVHRYYGWKVFRRSYYDLINPYYYHLIKINKWLTSMADSIEYYDYPKGFHIFKNKKDAEVLQSKLNILSVKNYIIKKVQFTEVLATGFQLIRIKKKHYYFPVIVANRIKIL